MHRQNLLKRKRTAIAIAAIRLASSDHLVTAYLGAHASHPSRCRHQEKFRSTRPPERRDVMIALSMRTPESSAENILPVAKDSEASGEDERKTARWGVDSTKRSTLNPLEALRLGLGAASSGVTTAKDALYGAVDTVSTVAEQVSTTSSSPSVEIRTVDRVNRRPRSILRTFAGGLITAKDSFWAAIGFLGNTVDALGNAPKAAEAAVAETRAAIQGAQELVEGVVRAPAVAAKAVSDATGSAVRIATSLKDGAYESLERASRISSMPAEMEERRRREQQEKERRGALKAAKSREAQEQIDKAVSAAKGAVWGAVEGVETVADVVTSTPAKVESGFGTVQETLEYTGDFVESVPRTLQDIPIQARQKVEDITTSVDSAQNAVSGFVDGVTRGFASVGSLGNRAVDVVTGKAREEKARREREANAAAREKKLKDAVLVIQGEPYTAKDLALIGFKGVGILVRGTGELVKNSGTFISFAAAAPSQLMQTLLGPVYGYQQSRKRVRQALEASQQVSPAKGDGIDQIDVSDASSRRSSSADRSKSYAVSSTTSSKGYDRPVDPYKADRPESEPAASSKIADISTAPIASGPDAVEMARASRKTEASSKSGSFDHESVEDEPSLDEAAGAASQQTSASMAKDSNIDKPDEEEKRSQESTWIGKSS